MHRIILAIAVLSALGHPAAAAPQCAVAADQSAYEILALRQMMTVLATKNCGREGDYNTAFVKRFQPALQANYRNVGAYFRRVYGGAGQGRMDTFTTELVNVMSQEASRQTVDFCGRTGLMIGEMNALRSMDDLAAYAAVKNLPPAGINMCPATAARRR